MPREPRTKTSWIPQTRINDMEKAELEKCAKLMRESVSEYIRRAVLDRNERIIDEWHKRKTFIDGRD